MTDNRGVRVDQSLRFAEQIVLLLADADSGQFARVPDWSLRCALAGAVLMDLALENRIDTDPEQLFLVDSSPVGDDLLDPTLAEIAQASEARGTGYWIRHTAGQAHRIRARVLERLVERGILHRREGRFLRVFPSQRYPTADSAADRDGEFVIVKRRIMAVLFSDDIPDPRDAAVALIRDGLAEEDHGREFATRRELDHAHPVHRAGTQAGPHPRGRARREHLARHLEVFEAMVDPLAGEQPAYVFFQRGRVEIERHSRWQTHVGHGELSLGAQQVQAPGDRNQQHHGGEKRGRDQVNLDHDILPAPSCFHRLSFLADRQ